MARLVIREKHPLWIRWSHWINFPLLGIMVWSGILIYWANDVYRPFFPKVFYDLFHIDHRLAEGMAIHFSFAWLFLINGIAYVAYLTVSRSWRHLLPRRRRLLRDSLQVALHDLGLTRELPPFIAPYNPAQRAAYTAIIIMGFLSIVTGLAIYKPIQLSWLTFLLGGYNSARLIHFGLTIGYVGFLVIHVAQVIRAGWSNFRSMVAGLEVTKDD